MGADEAGVEAIDFGGGDDFVAAAGTEAAPSFVAGSKSPVIIDAPDN
jgi:hypothetical protein